MLHNALVVRSLLKAQLVFFDKDDLRATGDGLAENVLLTMKIVHQRFIAEPIELVTLLSCE